MSESPAELSSRRAERKRQLAAELPACAHLAFAPRHGARRQRRRGARLKRSFASGPVLWVGGALLAGAAVSAALLWRRKKVVKVETKVLQLPWGRAKETDHRRQDRRGRQPAHARDQPCHAACPPMLMSWIQDKIRGKRQK